MANYTSDSFFDWIFGIIKQVNFFEAGTNFIVVALIVIVMAILISPKRLSNVKILALPLMMGLMICGLEVPLLFMVLGGIVFVMETLSVKGIGEGIEAMTHKVSDVYTAPRKIREGKKRRKIELADKLIGEAKKEKEIRSAEVSKLIPFRKGTSISEVMDIRASEEKKRILRMKNKTERDKAMELFFKRYGKDKDKYFEVDE